jgi:hypothetical protein
VITSSLLESECWTRLLDTKRGGHKRVQLSTAPSPNEPRPERAFGKRNCRRQPAKRR